MRSFISTVIINEEVRCKMCVCWCEAHEVLCVLVGTGHACLVVIIAYLECIKPERANDLEVYGGDM
jgi:hypothetical protein